MGSVQQKVALTLDMDWAPDFILEEVTHILLRHQVKATWFVTHQTPVLNLLREHRGLFELGIHPNFHGNSTHGREMDEVVRHCMQIVPEAISARSHALLQSEYLWRYYVQATPIVREVSTYIGPVSGPAPSRFHWAGGSLMRIPFIFQDNLEMNQPHPLWDAQTFLELHEGLAVLNFHPFYIYSNASSMDLFNMLKRTGIMMKNLSEEMLLSQRNSGMGARTLFLGLVQKLSEQGAGVCIRDIEMP